MNDINPPAAPSTNPSDQVNIPATGLMVAGGLGLLSQILALAIHFGLFALNLPFAGNSGMGSMGSMISGGITVALAFMGLAVNLFILYGAMQMKGLKNYNMAIGAAIAAVIPCFSSCPCCFVGIGFGIWAIIVLIKPEVKAAFQQA
ncbi:MAG TPA: hypothetical protein VFF76_10800 [Holophagaceae bacterium]|nr:hypothetical protein [Holophagaceae bacterium]